ncbi:uncharacterized protein MONOS_14017 [Monocercomonoides exilis]|uniref:uncharacterized protein n=1 Tax=Monocercomonoides exilis TaxID=2049356 RepID=UPI0035598495|nr:hypothetical protein MONOS_14017 [Monocercomonoides exilis]|eukprot:MONOS_14017.1-p1 / transcript=MONOS_14017.1 / gene=MONOS_14017 / organism=Monocercomonoides_exilis_PA203 / gene_product=unspecified product / transcript_product=unspecified product / location=Mono_scaffold00921:15655-16664(-) / protein_length=316 / sequence_SO=supercontig / SO=protein_coding / is_pseudo=false
MLQDLSPVLQPAPPRFQRSANWFNDALDSAGYRIELCLYQAFKAQLLSLADSDPHRESTQRGADAFLLIAKALQDARAARLQGRFGADFKGDMINNKLLNPREGNEQKVSYFLMIKRREKLNNTCAPKKISHWSKKDLGMTVFSERTQLTGNKRRKAAKRRMGFNELEILQPKSVSTIESEDGAKKGSICRTRIGGRTEFFMEAWERIGGAKLIRQCVKGTWKSKHIRRKLRDMQCRDGPVHSNEEQIKAFTDLLKEQIETGIVEEIGSEEVKYRNNVFLIRKKSEAWRQTLNCMRLNVVLIKTHFRCDNKKTVE